MSFQDLMVRQGVLEHGPKTPVVMGFECAGEVEALGENTSGFNVSFFVMLDCQKKNVFTINVFFSTHFMVGKNVVYIQHKTTTNLNVIDKP